ncbi:hypothetical protein CC85DRAFT_330544 [Cutaneotrichosporon oleaginosum]|uniref:Peptidase A1 domain-containing protein n=1 Tax=Cutaneotrichosporon oleaginosum TaxID=879819 RepID=A0A0J0XEZ6_9TREE|nr:uncharacterized protein CC85DRAFT_330544 [Cutaneotrichosporon oleaginosum]KLT39652.1 hypothetical protein CC85DRAFT_330544 [Cutaneotrichosporon oleaginosum]TXT07041.1 hypothetical protein COLE_06372 [Cutaneotrichosporon oleaginosum]
MLHLLPLLLAGAVASPAQRLAPRLSPPLNLTDIPITFPNKTASINISVGSPPQVIPVELSLASGQLQLSAFKKQDSSSFQDNPPRDNVQIGDLTLYGWTIGNETNDAGLGGTLPLGLVNRGNSKDNTYLLWSLADQIPSKTFALTIGLDNSTISFGEESSAANWWNPIEAAMGGWAFIIDGVAVDGQMAGIAPAPAPVGQTVTLSRPAATASIVPGSAPSLPAEVPPAAPFIAAAKRQATAAGDTRMPAPTGSSSSGPLPPMDPNNQSCVACTLEYKVCMCGEGEMCRRHEATCSTCPFLECVRNGTSTDTDNCVACPAIYRMCDCGPDEDCVRTMGTCRECETVTCRKRGSVTPANPQWEEKPDNGNGSGTGTGTRSDTSTTVGPAVPYTSGTVPTENKPNCTNPVMCPAIYQMCSCRADETCVRKSSCDRCEWLECHKTPKPFTDNGQCVQCAEIEPVCDCPRGATCVREPRSCTDCGRVTCRDNSNPGVRLALSLDDEIAVSPEVATALQKLIPGMVALGSASGAEKRAPTVSVTATAASAGADNTVGVSATPPFRPQGKTYYSVPCNTTANITLVFPGANYTLQAKDWVVPQQDGCQALLVMQDTFFYDVILGRPFLRTVRAAFRLNDTATVAFSARNASTGGLSAMQGTSGAGVLGASLACVFVALAAACLF